MDGRSPAGPSICLLKGRPFCTHSWRMDSARHPPASLTIKWKDGKHDFVIDTLFFNGFLWGGKSSLSFCCVLSRCLAGPLSCSSLLYKGCRNHVYQPELSTETCQYYECLCIQETLFVGSPGIAVNALLALPLNYWDVLFILLPSSPKPTTF